MKVKNMTQGGQFDACVCVCFGFFFAVSLLCYLQLTWWQLAFFAKHSICLAPSSIRNKYTYTVN